MKIGIDIDDTITETSEYLKVLISKYDKEYNYELSSSIEKIMRGILDTPKLQKFYHDHAVELIRGVKLKDDVKDTIDYLIQEGCEIYFITSRSDMYFGNAYKETKEYLDKNKIKYDKLLVGQGNKVKACEDEKIDIMIDDSISTCELINTKLGKDSLVYNSNLNIEKETNCKRFSEWSELKDYIINVKNQKNKLTKKL